MQINHSMQNTRFGNAAAISDDYLVKPSFMTKTLYPMAERYLTASKRIGDFFDNKVIPDPKAAWYKRIFRPPLRGIRWVLTEFAKQDYHKVANFELPRMGKWFKGINFGRIILDPSPGNFMAFSFGFMLTGRLSHAFKRAFDGEKKDYRELRDIIFRDIPSFIIVIWGMTPAVRTMCTALQKWSGIKLVHTDANGARKALSYSELENYFRMKSPNRIMALVLDQENHDGMMTTLKKILHQKDSVAGPARQQLGIFKNKLEAAIKLVNKTHLTPENQKAFYDELKALSEEAYKHLRSAENLRLQSFLVDDRLPKKAIAYLKKAVQKGELDDDLIQYIDKKLYAGSLKNRVEGLIRGEIPAFNKMFYYTAKKTRFWADFAALAAIIGILGMGVTWFNEWFTNREFKKLQAQEDAKAGKKRGTPDLMSLLNAMQASPTFSGYAYPNTTQSNAFTR